MEIGRILNGRYNIVERIGSGGMSTVYKAHEVGLEREVAVKVLISTLSGDPQLIERFNREAKTIASLQHNSIIPIYYYGIEDDFGSFLVMPMLQGGTLEQRLHQLTILPTLAEVGEIAEKLGSALQYAHDKGVVHRDIKFSNIMFDDAGSPYLMDFGIAKLLNTTNLTGTGMTVGTPNFMPPEQWRNDEITPAVDQYAFSVLLYAMLTRRMPFEADTAPALMYQHLQQTPPLVSDFREDVPRDIEEALHKALSKEPEDRFESISEFTRIIAQSALASTREYSGFFKAPIERRTQNKTSTTGLRPQNMMPNTPTEMVADKRFDGAKTTFGGESGQARPSEQMPSPVAQDTGGVNRGAFWGAMLTVMLIGIIVIGGGLFFFSQMMQATQQTETAVAQNAAASETALALVEASETLIAFEIQSVNETATREAEPTVTPVSVDSDTPTPEPSETDMPTIAASHTADATGTQQVIILTEGAIEQATNNGALRMTGTALAELQTQGAANNATEAANANSFNTATVEAAQIQTEQSNNDVTGTAIAVRNTAQAASASSTQQARDRDSTATAFAVIQTNFDATATQIAFMATQAASNRLDYGEAVSGIGTGETEVRWTFSVNVGDVISISGRSPDFDPLIEVYRGDVLIASDNDDGYLNNARISNLEFSQNGEYQIVLRATSGDDLIGEYTVGITEMLTCPSSLEARLLVGDFGRVTFEGLKNNLRSNPNPASSRMALIPNGDVFEVIEGPVCNEDFTWYRVEYEGNIGWTAESNDEDYWLELLPDDDEAVLLAGGLGLTNSIELAPGTFQVEAFCSRRGLTTSTDEVDWFCVNASNVVVITLEEEDFAQICRDTYNEEEAFARQDGDATEAAYRWLCYYYPQ